MQTVQITDDDVGKEVVESDGDTVGLVSGIRHGTAYVDPDPGLATKLKTKLGWEDIDEEEGYPLQEAKIDTITDEEVRLTSDL